METISYPYHTGLIFGMEKLTVFTRVQSIIVPVVGPIHTDMIWYHIVLMHFVPKQAKEI